MADKTDLNIGEWLKNAADVLHAAGVQMSGELKKAEEPVQEEKWPMPHSLTRNRLSADGRTIYFVPDPGKDEEFKVLLEGNQMVVRSKQTDPEHFHMDWIDHIHDSILTLPFNAVIKYEGTDPGKPLPVIFHSNEAKIITQTGESAVTQLPETGVHLLFLGSDPEKSVISFDMTRQHGSGHPNKFPVTVELDGVKPELVLAPHVEQCEFHHKERFTRLGDSQIEIIPADSGGNVGSVLFSLAADRNYNMDMVTRGSDGDAIARVTVPHDCNTLRGFLEHVNDLLSTTQQKCAEYEAVQEKDRAKLEYEEKMKELKAEDGKSDTVKPAPYLGGRLVQAAGDGALPLAMEVSAHSEPGGDRLPLPAAPVQRGLQKFA